MDAQGSKSARECPEIAPGCSQRAFLWLTLSVRWVFTRNNEQIDGRRITEAFKQAVSAAGLDGKLHLHSLRHSFCTILLANGASITDVATIAGHSTVVVTQRYMHLKGEAMHHATDLLTRSRP